MLGYYSEEELKAAGLAADLYAEPDKRARVSRRELERKGVVRNEEISAADEKTELDYCSG